MEYLMDNHLMSVPLIIGLVSNQLRIVVKLVLVI